MYRRTIVLCAFLGLLPGVMRAWLLARGEP